MPDAALVEPTYFRSPHVPPAAADPPKEFDATQEKGRAPSTSRICLRRPSRKSKARARKGTAHLATQPALTANFLSQVGRIVDWVSFLCQIGSMVNWVGFLLAFVMKVSISFEPCPNRSAPEGSTAVTPQLLLKSTAHSLSVL